MSRADESGVHDLQDASRSDGAREVSGELIQGSLTQIFQSGPFRSSKQSQHLLQYIVDQSLAGHGELLKERLIGVNVFGRRPDYDTNEDPVVRARAGEVRKRLAQFYLGEGSQSAIRIEISPGSYHACFIAVPQEGHASSPEPLAIADEPKKADAADKIAADEDRHAQRHTPRIRRKAQIALAVGLLPCLLAGGWYLFRPAAPIDAFWQPIIAGPSPVLLYSGANAVYMMSPEFINRYQTTHHLDPLERQGREFVVPISSGMKLEPSDLVGYKNDFITLGDLAANVRIASLLTGHRKRFDLRSGGDVAFGDLRQSPTILIGAFNNSWTMELTGDLPFIFSRGLTIRDQTDANQHWSPVDSPDGTIQVDYAIVTRMPHSKTGEPIVTVAGITQAGTRAAAEFITQPDSIQALVKAAPKDWEDKNMEVVLQTKVVNEIPTNPRPIASRYW